METTYYTEDLRRTRVVARIAQFVDYGFGLLYALFAVRFALALLAARSTAGFVQFIVKVTDPFYAPFKGIVASHQLESGHTVLMPLVVAFVAYLLLHLAIRGLLRIIAQRRTTV
ncbi:MAG: YggT family protein [Myxococcales bacterium]|nr:YggT family protein [Myxococcales bacterium]